MQRVWISFAVIIERDYQGNMCELRSVCSLIEVYTLFVSVKGLQCPLSRFLGFLGYHLDANPLDLHLAPHHLRYFCSINQVHE